MNNNTNLLDLEDLNLKKWQKEHIQQLIEISDELNNRNCCLINNRLVHYSNYNILEGSGLYGSGNTILRITGISLSEFYKSKETHIYFKTGIKWDYYRCYLLSNSSGPHSTQDSIITVLYNVFEHKLIDAPILNLKKDSNDDVIVLDKNGNEIK